MSDNRSNDAITGFGLFVALLLCAPFFMYKTLSPTKALTVEIYEQTVQILDEYEGRYPDAANWADIQRQTRTNRDRFLETVHQNLDENEWWPVFRHFQFIWWTLQSGKFKEGLVEGLIGENTIPKGLPNIYAEASK